MPGDSRDLGWHELMRPPIGERRFWVVQVLVVGIFLIHEAGDGRVPIPLIPGGFELFPVVALFIPVLYAGLYYGFDAAVATTATATALIFVDLGLDAPRYSRQDIVVFFTQLVIFDAIAILVARRIGAEHEATRRAHQAAREAEDARNRYRNLFEDSSAPILILDREGRVVEGNAASAAAFGELGAAGRTLAGLIGPAVAARLLDEQRQQAITISTSEHGALLFEATRTGPARSAGGDLIEVVFHDVTTERLRHRQAAAYARAMVRGQEEERRHLAQELHDQPLQTLIHMCRCLDTALSTEDSEVARRTVEEAYGTGQGTIGALRDIVRGLRPPALDDVGVVACLQRLVSDVGERSGLAATFIGPPEEVRLPGEVEVTVFRIVQAALSNVERHAAAGEVTVSLTIADAQVVVHVRDDGIGFTPPDDRDPSPSTFGLIGMRERAALLGGSIEIRSAPGEGTEVVATLPLSGATDAAA